MIIEYSLLLLFDYKLYSLYYIVYLVLLELLNICFYQLNNKYSYLLIIYQIH